MRILSRTLAVCLLLAFTSQSRASSITASASDAGCGFISVSGTITLDAGSMAEPANVEVFSEGNSVSTFTASVICTSFSGTSTGSFAPGTYTVMVTVPILDACSQKDDYTYRTTVTVK